MSSTDRKTGVCMRDGNTTALSPWSTWGRERSKGQRHNHEILRHRAFIALKIRCDTGRIQRYSLFVFFATISRKGWRGATYLVFVATADRPRPSRIVIAVLNAWFFSLNTHGASLICVYRWRWADFPPGYGSIHSSSIKKKKTSTQHSAWLDCARRPKSP